ncbi:MAG TPA: pyrroline-5-carboxylate reductase [Candidatus Thiothrix moscowensis]|uniref:pyrroline-5-carboxylate reductase n=1 Tax=unclassified Thiothrix TaxID=2636184 RepID=UPI0025E2346E|nr:MULTISPECIES: pyrroline-5-carboxylate reductase [unclassified Thiothrix]HRJ51808.1 pyrroline-5-carboxylate reductase [Candidatus Thiothrix moscowensis]HRJ92123.1 pyrroline-5-carboxylate reductase [Candidatus Thiothrix moscowensis]
MDTPKLAQKPTTITFIGAGNMARSLIVGLLQDQANVSLRVADPDQNQLDAIRRHWPDVLATTDNQQAMLDADVVVLAVKPQVMCEVAESLRDIAQRGRPLFVSIAAGIREEALNRWLGGNLPIVRCMPNTPALVQAGATGLFANEHTSEEQRSLAESILRAVGITLWFEEESKLDAVTAISGSGPAYFFLVMEAMQAAAEKLGLKAEDAHLLIVQTALGAARLALESNDPPAELRRKVTSKGGTTAAALQVLNDGGLVELFDQALKAAENRSRELAAANS